MSLTTVHAVSYDAMAEFLAGANPLGACATLAARHDRVWVVSVTNSARCPLNCFEGWDDGPVPLVQDGEDRVALAFDDIEPKVDAASGIELGRDGRYVYFDEAMARRVCAFVDRAHRDDAASDDLLLVNCHAGVSRSGAIADFARTVVGMDYGEFRRLNPQVVPNVFVRRLLFEAWMEMGLPAPTR
jgi:predicted protein tyrosine phosphatase